MTTAAVITTVLVWLLFIGGLAFCFSRLGKGGKWED
jgi:preprotein translocase subunit SecE